MGRQRTSRASAATAAQAGSAQGAAQKVRRERRTRKTRGKIRSRSSTALSMPLLASSVRTGAVFVKSVRTGAAFVTSSKFACGEEHRRGKARGRARVPTVRAAHGTQRASARATARTLIDPEPAERGGRVGQSGPPEHKHIRGKQRARNLSMGRNRHGGSARLSHRNPSVPEPRLSHPRASNAAWKSGSRLEHTHCLCV